MRTIRMIEWGKGPALLSLQPELAQAEGSLYVALLLLVKGEQRENNEEGNVASGNPAQSEPLLIPFRAA